MMGLKTRKRICGILLVLNLCFIWGNSLLPAQASQAFSDGTGSLMGLLLNLGELTELGSVLVRKAAHFLEFLTLGILLTWLLQLSGKRTGYAALWGLLAACLDEGIQFFVPGRAPGLADVAIDLCGVVTGMVLLQMGYGIIRGKQPIQHGGN